MSAMQDILLGLSVICFLLAYLDIKINKTRKLTINNSMSIMLITSILANMQHKNDDDPETSS